MKLFRVFAGLAIGLAVLTSLSIAQPPSPCNPCVTFCTFTQGGWGAPCNGGNAGCIRNECFNAIYPNGVTVGRDYPGGCCWIHLTSSQAVEDFLPQGTTPEALTHNYTDPGVGNITVFAGQVLALQLNVDYGAYGCSGMVDIAGLQIASGLFAGWTIQELLTAANIALGGGPLPPGVSIDDLNNACNDVNENFDDCTNNNGYIEIPPMGETIVVRNVGDPLPSSFCLNFQGNSCGDFCVVWWCNFCDPNHDFAEFTWVPGCNGPDCDQQCTPNPGTLVWSDQHIFQYNTDGSCWWYARAHVEERCNGCFCVSFENQLAANLIAFTASPGNNDVTLNWSTASELNNARFEIQRTTDQTSWATIASVPGQGTSTTTTPYRYEDRSVTNGVAYQYRLISVDINGRSGQVGQVASATPLFSAGTPREFALYQNYPNPFNPSTQIRFDISEASHVTLRVFDVMGREVATLVNDDLAARSYEVSFNSSGLASGTYFYRLTAGSFTAMNKMLILK